MKKSYPCNYPEESAIEDHNYWHEKMVSWRDIMSNCKSHERSRCETLSRKMFEFAPESILSDESFMLNALSQYLIGYYHINENLRGKRAFAKKYLCDIDHSYFFALNEEQRDDEELFLIALKKRADSYRDLRYTSELRKKYFQAEHAAALIAINPRVYEHFGKGLKKELAKIAMEHDIKNIRYMLSSVSKPLFKTRELGNAALEINENNFSKLHNKLRDDEEFLLPWIKKHPQIFAKVSPRLKTKKDFAVHAAGYYDFLSHIPEEMKYDRDLMQKHFNSNFYSHKHIASYMDIKPLFVAQAKKTTYWYDMYPDEFKKDPDVLYQILKHDSYYKLGAYGSSHIMEMLPSALREELAQDYNLSHERRIFSYTQETNDMLLSFARSKYSEMHLSKNLDDKKDMKKIKI